MIEIAIEVESRDQTSPRLEPLTTLFVSEDGTSSSNHGFRATCDGTSVVVHFTGPSGDHLVSCIQLPANGQMVRRVDWTCPDNRTRFDLLIKAEERFSLPTGDLRVLVQLAREALTNRADNEALLAVYGGGPSESPPAEEEALIRKWVAHLGLPEPEKIYEN